MAYTCNSSSEGRVRVRDREKWTPGACWPVSLAILVSSGFNERPCLKKFNGKQLKKFPEVNLWPFACIHACTSTRVHTHTCAHTHSCTHLPSKFQSSQIPKPSTAIALRTSTKVFVSFYFIFFLECSYSSVIVAKPHSKVSGLKPQHQLLTNTCGLGGCSSVVPNNLNDHTQQILWVRNQPGIVTGDPVKPRSWHSDYGHFSMAWGGNHLEVSPLSHLSLDPSHWLGPQLGSCTSACGLPMWSVPASLRYSG